MQAQTPLSKEEAVKTLQGIVQGYLDKSPRRSIASLARDSRVGETSLRRLMNDGVLPINDNIVKIVATIKDAVTNRDLVANQDQSVVDLIQYALPYKMFDFIKDYAIVSASVEESLGSSTKKLIFAKASAGAGISKSEIKDDFGRLGLVAAEELSSSGLLIDLGDSFKVAPEYGMHTLSLAATKDLLAAAVKAYYKPETQTNYGFAVYESVTSKTYGEIMGIYEDAFKRVVELVKQNPGDVPVFAGGFMDTMTTSNFFEKKEV